MELFLYWITPFYITALLIAGFFHTNITHRVWCLVAVFYYAPPYLLAQTLEFGHYFDGNAIYLAIDLVLAMAFIALRGPFLILVACGINLLADIAVMVSPYGLVFDYRPYITCTTDFLLMYPLVIGPFFRRALPQWRDRYLDWHIDRL